jgi:nucleotide-binding universal stress UspA family protein
MPTIPHDGAAEPWQQVQEMQRTRYCPLFPTISIHQLLVPLSGAPFAERALPYAVALAAATGAGISLVFVEAPGAQPGAGTPDAPATGSAADPAGYLAELRVPLAMRVPRLATCIVRAATVARGLADAECTEGIDLVVLATRPLGDTANHAMGEFAVELLRHGSAPALFIPPEAPPPVESARVLVALDGSRLAERALFPIVAVANAGRRQFIKEITLLMACDERREMGAATAYLDDVRVALGRAVATTISVRAEAVRHGAHGAAEAIARRVREPTPRRFDALAMTTHGHGGYGGIGGKLLGGVIEFVLPRAPVPVLVVNPRRP